MPEKENSISLSNDEKSMVDEYVILCSGLKKGLSFCSGVIEVCSFSAFNCFVLW